MAISGGRRLRAVTVIIVLVILRFILGASGFNGRMPRRQLDPDDRSKPPAQVSRRCVLGTPR